MTKEKKRLSKNAKAAQKILEGSKLLATVKTPSDSKTDEHFKAAEVLPRPSAANKLRPQKKRG